MVNFMLHVIYHTKNMLKKQKKFFKSLRYTFFLKNKTGNCMVAYGKETSFLHLTQYILVV